MGCNDEFLDVTTCRFCLATVRFGIQLKTAGSANQQFLPGDGVHPELLDALRRSELEMEDILCGQLDPPRPVDDPYDFDICGRPWFESLDCPCGALKEDELPGYAIIRDGVYLGMQHHAGCDAAWVGAYGIVSSKRILALHLARAGLTLG